MTEKRLRKDGFAKSLALSVKGVAKLLLQSRRATYGVNDRGTTRIIIMGNGPSLAETVGRDLQKLRESDTMAVNFAANAPEFRLLRPKYYILADKHFFDNADDPNVALLMENLQSVDWECTLFLPFEAKRRCAIRPTPYLSIQYYNLVGVEGFKWFRRAVYSSRRGMPRPRNVLIPAIMTAIGMGYTEIFLVGADHSWTSTLAVDEENNVLTRQPHFYAEDSREIERIRSVYYGVPLHEVVYSFYLAFRAYFSIREFADSRGVKIYNSTPGSFIDAFERRLL